jgi:pimeloyl-ACP methyl ester carboxylesterase
VAHDLDGIALQQVEANGIRINVATAGAGPAVLLLHGWPHTWLLWRHVMRGLAPAHRLIAPDLRGLGATDKPDGGYDLHTLAAGAAGLLDALGVERAAVVGIDLGGSVAWMTAMRHPARVERLVLMESLLGRLPGAEAFLAGGPPWWFAFHATPELPETVLAGHEAEYIEWFLRAGTHDGQGIEPEARDAFVAAYRDPRALHCGFEHYRALARNAELVAAAARRRLEVPVLALGGGVVGDALQRQLEPITDDLRGEVLPGCGHIVPEDAPGALLARVEPFLAAGVSAGAGRE